jgi:nicotinamidase-related amidase
MRPTTHLLIIDPQNDFCDLPPAWRPADPVTGAALAPALPVAGAHADMLRVAALIRGAGSALAQITVTLDSHHRLDIAHPGFWQTGAGDAAPPFTPITAQQVRDGFYRPRAAAAFDRALAYLDELEARGRYTLMVWPVHCEIGTWGHDVHAAVRAAYGAWEERTLRGVRKVTKGENPWTEHYSALQAEVPMTDDPRTQLDTALLAELDRADRLLIAGEAGSHCVRATVEHIVANLPGGHPERVVLLTDCISPVGGFEAAQAEFLAAMRRLGVRLADSPSVLAELDATNVR